MVAPVVLAIDAMSGDRGHEVAVVAVLSCLRRFPYVEFVLVGDETALRQTLAEHSALEDRRITIRHASEVVEMDELPSRALRNKKDSSMRVAIEQVRRGEASAAVSAGNTGALMATARFVLKTLPGIERPAFMSPLPTLEGFTQVLDLGANTDCSADQLYQFALMGSAFVSAVQGIRHPRVALLNIGQEEIKGGEVIRQAAELLTASELNYVGYIEGDGIFMRPVEVVVCDGFVGNVALKTGEGVANLLRAFMLEEFKRSFGSRLAGLAARPVLRALSARMDPRRYNGASLLGLSGTVVKSHGAADAVAFESAIRVAIDEVENEVPQRIGEMLVTHAAPDQAHRRRKLH